MNQPININVNIITGSNSDNRIKSGNINNLYLSHFDQFDYHNGVNLIIFGKQTGIVKSFISVNLTGSVWQNWPSGSQQADTDYLVSSVCSILNVTGTSITSSILNGSNHVTSSWKI